MNITVNIRRWLLQNTPGQFILLYKAASPEFEYVSPVGYYYTLGTLDVPNAVFPDHAAAISNYESTGVSVVMANMDSYYSADTHTLGWVRDDSTDAVLTNLIEVTSSKLDATAVNSDVYVGDSPADATTDYDPVTTILGALVSAVNDANTKQNDIATKLNEVIAALKTVGILKTSP